MRRPVDALATMAHLLAPDGVVYVSVPDMRPNDKPAFERFHFAHVHGFVPETLLLAAWRAGLVPDERFGIAATTMVLRRSRPCDPEVRPDPEVAIRLIDGYAGSKLGPHIASGKWFMPMIRRWTKALRDSRRYAVTK